MPEESRSIIPDAIRGAAALFVAMGHAWQIFLFPYTGKNIGMTIMGGVATWSVAIFFILSGMLIGGSVKRRVSSGTFLLMDYALARFLRIYPPLFAAVIVTISCVLIIRYFDLYGAEAYLLDGDLGSARERAEIDWSAVTTTLTLTYQLVPGHGFIFFNGPLWSLSYEVWMYVFAGLVTFATFRGSLIGWLAAAALVYLMLFVSTAGHPAFWVVGAVWGIGFLYGWVDERLKQYVFENRWLIISIGLTACLVVGGGNILEFLPAPYTGVRQHVFYVSFSVIVFYGMVILLRWRAFEGSTLCQFLAWASGFSYTLYLLHFPLFLLSLSLFRPSMLPFGIVGAIGLAVVSFTAVCGISSVVARYAEDRMAVERSFRAFFLRSRFISPAE